MNAKLLLPLLSLPIVFLLLAADEPKDGTPYGDWQTPGRYRHWIQSADQKIAVHLTADKTTFTAAEGLTIRCVVRNLTDKPMTILRPFGDEFFVISSGLSILGPSGIIGYVGPQKDYMLGESSFVELPAKSLIEETFAIPKDHLPGVGAPGLYIIDCRYISNGYPKQPAPANFWQGQVDPAPVTLLVK